MKRRNVGAPTSYPDFFSFHSQTVRGNASPYTKKDLLQVQCKMGP